MSLSGFTSVVIIADQNSLALLPFHPIIIEHLHIYDKKKRKKTLSMASLFTDMYEMIAEMGEKTCLAST